MEPLLVLSLLVSFLITLFFTPVWIKKAHQTGLIWEDMNKPDHPKNVAGSGGISVLLGFSLGVLFYIALKVFYFKTNGTLIELFALLTSVIIISFVGFIDDLLGWHKGGLSKASRIILLFCAAVPLMVINAGQSHILGIEFGLLYPLIIIPLGIVGVSATYNFLAGYNGLEAGQGIIILSAMGFATWKTGNPWLTVVCLCMVAALTAFYFFNKYPAKVFPGDILTYAIGSLIAIVSILGDLETIAAFFFIPYILEVVLKARGKLKKQSFGKPNDDGSLEIPYEKIYGLEHLAIYLLQRVKPSKKVHEKDVVYTINFFQIVIIIIGILIFL
ncbi:MAG TPA: glycosyl transferase family 4 [Candidatus Nanoarchaeia archaeon]|nr:glycosyl transferase family 4 [Candidatus Nanoarchaeia archaeon]